MKRIALGIVAHVDAGKTTLTEALLYTSGGINKLGRVDHRDSFLDNAEQERERGITIFSKQALLTWKDTEVTLLDTPGHVDFSTETERALQVMDYAVLVISGTDGVQAHTETLWSLLKRYGKPVFIFITKMDASSLPDEELMRDLQEHLSDSCVCFSADDGSREEAIASLSEEALEEFLSVGQVSDEVITQMIRKREIYPCFFGSGLRLNGIEALLDAIDRYTVQPAALPAFSAKVFKIARDSKIKRLTYLKITGGKLNVRQSIRYLPVHGSDALEEKIAEIRLYSGRKYETCEVAEAGQVCAVLGLSGTWPGLGLGLEEDSSAPVLEPVLGYTLILPKGTDAQTMLPKLRQLEEEDPQLHILWLPAQGEIQVQLMGAVQTDVLKALIKERFETDVKFGPGRILYRETIAAPVEGVGHYEPLKHYAEVHLILEPGEPGSGLVFDSLCHTDDLDLNWQRLILTHLEEKQHLGVLTGSPITDMKITLAAGRAHLKHTEGGDFRQATYRAVRHGLMNAKNILLEPIYAYTLEVPSENTGRAMSDLHAMGGEHEPPVTGEKTTVLTGFAPVAAMQDYQTEVMAYTSGKGRFSCRSAGYRPCENAEKVISEASYFPESDLDNPPDSVFCAHGAGFVVKWQDVPQYMHLPAVLASEAEAAEATDKNDKNASSAPYAAPLSRTAPLPSIDEKELEAIMDREFGPIRRKQYSAPTVNGAAVKQAKFIPRKERLIVDGYNLMFAWEELKALASENLDAAREKLTNIMVNYSAYVQNETVLVFDAYKVPGGQGEKYDSAGLHVAFTRENESADLYIERLADEIGKNENVRVVTSDSLIRLTALRSGVLRTSSKEFINEVNDTLEQMRKKYGR